ncbi:hypothetical protein LINGRAHAP2_LOCUS15024 [Linum grandiflorum]
MNHGIWYHRCGEQDSLLDTDSDYAGDIDDRKSTSGYVSFLAGGAISWASKKHDNTIFCAIFPHIPHSFSLCLMPMT